MVSVLPHSEVKLLNELDKSSRGGFYRRLTSLHQAGWSLQSLSNALGVGRSTIYYWISQAAPLWEDQGAEFDDYPPLPTPPQKSKTPQIKSPVKYPTRTLPLDVLPHQREEIKRLAPIARKYRGGSAPDSPAALARRQLDFLVIHNHRRGVPISRLAEIAGVTYRAMSIRINEGLYR